MSGFTKEIIIRTLFELLNEKPLAKITVKDIVERCGVNRNTFYYHFRDISDVVESALLREVDNAFEHPVEVDSMLECLEVLTREDGERIEIQDDKLYHVVTDLYTGQMLGSVMKMSYGLLSLEPKDKNGNPIENLEDQAIMEDGRELKAWDAIARYMQSFEDTDGDGIANVPEYYAVTHNRKVVDDSTNIIDLVKNPNRFSVMIVLICLLFLVIIILIVVLIRKLVRKAKKKSM